jgi:hypothetical protein
MSSGTVGRSGTNTPITPSPINVRPVITRIFRHTGVTLRAKMEALFSYRHHAPLRQGREGGQQHPAHLKSRFQLAMIRLSSARI